MQDEVAFVVDQMSYLVVIDPMKRVDHVMITGDTGSGRVEFFFFFFHVRHIFRLPVAVLQSSFPYRLFYREYHGDGHFNKNTNEGAKEARSGVNFQGQGTT